MRVYSWVSGDLVFAPRSSGCALGRQPEPMKARSMVHHATEGFRSGAE